MNPTVQETLTLNGEELAALIDLLEAKRTELLGEIHHTGNRAFRDALRHRLAVLEGLVERCRLLAPAG